MRLSMNFLGKNARHSFLMAICLFMLAGVYSCSEDQLSSDPPQPMGMDDASLLAWQMNKMNLTKSGTSFDVALVTTAISFEFNSLVGKGEYSIDWGDGSVDTNVKSHTYTDGEPAHTIFIYGDFNGENSEIVVYGQSLIYADISRCPDLVLFTAVGNRLTNIDLSRNIGLRACFLSSNKISFLDLSNVVNLHVLDIGNNPLTNVDVTKCTKLDELYLRDILIQNIDLSNNRGLRTLFISGSSITSVDIKNLPNLLKFYCENCPINNLDFSQHTRIVILECSGTNITSLDLSNANYIKQLACSNSNIENITFSTVLNNLSLLAIKNTSIEQNPRKMTSLALSLPDRSATSPGELYTLTPHLSMVSSLLTGYNWNINPQ